MPDPTPGGRPAQFRSLFRSIVLDLDLLSHHVLAVANVARIVAEEVGTTSGRIFTPLVTLCTFLSQVLSDDHSCRAAVARLMAWRLCRRAAPVLPRHRRLLQGAAATPRDAPAPAGPRHRRRAPGGGPRSLAVPRPQGHPRRRLDGQHARHAREPGRVPPARQPGARLRVPDRPDRRPDRAGHRGGPRRGGRPAQGQAVRREHVAPGPAWAARVRGYPAVGPLFLLVFRGRDALGPRASTSSCGSTRTGRWTSAAAIASGTTTTSWCGTSRSAPSWMGPEAYAAIPETVTIRELRVRVGAAGLPDAGPDRDDDAAGRRASSRMTSWRSFTEPGGMRSWTSGR